MNTDGSLQLVSRHIAPEMMILDGPHNGWRYLILPMARTDSLVRDAILAVSCFHLCLSSINTRCPSAEDAVSQWQFPGPGLNPRHLYARAIKGLHSRQLMSYDGASQLPILVTIMVLLTSSMVTGDQDFPILFRMLQSAFDALGGEQGLGQCDLAAFLVRQIHKLFVYAAPLISQENGLQTMQSPVRMMQVFECLNYCAQQQPKHQQVITTAISLIHQAREIYLNQTPPLQRSSEDPFVSARSVARVQAFIDTLQCFPQDQPGEHVLLWASFVAASDCTIDVHKDYFESFFRRHHARNGFMNLLKAVDFLRRIWGRGLPEKWACLLPEEKLFVM
ncbi:unnamed protein product [Clonostachys rhizophaga]|uniref:Uncharacterized protein n=1 Tax=Clonostachys rhizophaga TaxID=160324 RepID=A0A9N9W382_9HYPO|nr:unnamed protein product [Clonostachys rhizophaga]